MDIHLSNIRIVEAVTGERFENASDSESMASDHSRSTLEIASEVNKRLNLIQDQLVDAGFPKSSRITFHQDKESGHLVIEVVDTKSNQVLRRLPPEEFRQMINTSQTPRGVITDQTF